MRGNNVLTKLKRKVRAGNLVWRRREVSRAKGEQIMVQIGATKDPYLEKWSAARKREAKDRKVLDKERKKIRARNKKNAQK